MLPRHFAKQEAASALPVRRPGEIGINWLMVKFSGRSPVAKSHRSRPRRTFGAELEGVLAADQESESRNCWSMRGFGNGYRRRIAKRGITGNREGGEGLRHSLLQTDLRGQIFAKARPRIDELPAQVRIPELIHDARSEDVCVGAEQALGRARRSVAGRVGRGNPVSAGLLSVLLLLM